MGETDAGVAEGDAHDHEHEHRSRWPIVGAAGAAILYTGAALALVGNRAGIFPSPVGVGIAVVGFAVLTGGLVGWLRQAYLSDYWARAASDRKRRAYRATMVIFLVTDVATFGAGFVYYFYVRIWTWPPGELPELVGSLVLVNTALLVASSVTLHFAHEALDEGHRRRFLALLGATFALGVVFLAGQIAEYATFVGEEEFTLTSGVFASAFFGLTGLHGLHVALGVVLVGIVLWRALRGQYDAERDTSVSTVSLYWHFVDAVWLFLVAVLYVGAEISL
ncbi:heme-copper oxidase subunit III [Halorussus gelatinilyticus]|uniref:Heme-copper oxidase subunit III n=1 Tax=Halorussus gelatinilyticus TaxID=2937524 RepID=A0A8U0IJP1_9EURY|nr:heme-copper oxidase subunit III [Halorussus gelatinilyticus]UPW00871.1 heme-copper oxidase subunit III [Halorussus gelatinilyticus]